MHQLGVLSGGDLELDLGCRGAICGSSDAILRITIYEKTRSTREEHDWHSCCARRWVLTAVTSSLRESDISSL